MKAIDIIRAWKDEEFRNSLSESERQSLPSNPAGLLELTDEVLDEVGGGSCVCCSCNKTKQQNFETTKV